MKIATYIFAIYMLALSFVPCGDGGGGIVEIANHLFDTEHQVHTDHEQPDPCGGDLCSPFCICSCCSLVLDFTEKMPLWVKSPNPVPKVAPSFAPNIIPSSFPTSIWQPPQFS